MNKPMHRKNKEGFGMQTKAPYNNEASKEGDLYFKSGKDACISSNLMSIAYLFCRYFMKQNSQWDPTRLI
jgi:hypothetical protein